jgi:collagenase-like PrtC family protease
MMSYPLKSEKIMEAELWTIPYIDMPIHFWHKLKEDYSLYIDEVYLPLPGGDTPSGRPEQSSRFVMDFLRDSPFPVSFLINPIVLDKPIEDLSDVIIDKLMEMCDQYNVRSVTLSNLMLAQHIKRRIPELRLHASVLMDIFAPAQIVYINEVFDVLVPSSRIIRDLKALRVLKKSFNGEVKLIVNEGCLPHCVLRNQHFYEMGCKFPYPKSLCKDILKEKPWLGLTGSWILPQHLHLYEDVFDKLKLSGRVTLQNSTYYNEVLKSYIIRKPRRPHKIGAGPVCSDLNFHIEDYFFETLLNCNKMCHDCNICEEYYEKNKYAAI